MPSQILSGVPYSSSYTLDISQFTLYTASSESVLTQSTYLVSKIHLPISRRMDFRDYNLSNKTEQYKGIRWS